jgi:cell division septal protein FtsQ
MATILYIKFIKEVLAQNEWAVTMQSLILVGFFLFFAIAVLFVVTRPKNYYKEISEVPLENDSQISILD